MQSRQLDVAIVPPDSISLEAIDISHAVSEWGTYFKLNQSGPFPHISLYQAEFPLANIDAIKSKLSEYASRKKAFSITPVAEVYKLEDKDFLEVQYSPNDDNLRKLHTETIELLNELREGLTKYEDKELFNKLPDELKGNIRKWGYRLTGSAFRPHLTLARLKNPKSIPINTLPNKDFSFTVSQIALFELGDHGTCVNEIETYKLDG